MFALPQKILLPLICFPVLLIFYLLYRVGKRPIRGSNTYEGRMEPLYSVAAAAFLCQFFFQILRNATGPTGTSVGVLISAFVVLGFYIMLCIQKCQRVTHDNPLYVSPKLASCVEIRSIVDAESMTLVDYMKIDDPESTEMADNRLQVTDEVAELRKRRRICVLTIVVSSLICFLEGFFLVYREPTTIGGNWVIFAFFVAGKFLETFAIGVTMLHAYVHTRTNEYAVAAVWWAIVCTLSTTPALTDMDWARCFEVVNHLATGIFYALAGGIIFWIALYFVWMDRLRVDKRDTAKWLALFGGTAVVAWVIGYFI